MRLKVSIISLVLVLLLSLIGCDGTGGTATGGRQSCKTTGSSGTCEGSYKKITGRFTVDVEDEFMGGGDTVEVEAPVAVENGALRVEITSPDDEAISDVARPQRPPTVIGPSKIGAFDALSVVLEVVEGEQATGVTYTIAWHRP